MTLANNVLLKPGEVRIGHILNATGGDFPAQVGVLTIDEEGRIELALPYLSEAHDEQNPQYAKTRQWSEKHDARIPGSLWFFDQKGWVTLVGFRWAGYSNTNNGSGTGYFYVRSAIFSRSRSIEDSYPISQFISTIDGLDSFGKFSPLKFNDDLKEGVWHSIEVPEEEVFEWQGGKFKYQISSSFILRSGSKFELKNAPPRLTTTHEDGASLLDHLNAQLPIRALLILVYGTSLSWRSHSVLSDSFPIWGWDEPMEMQAPVEVLLFETAAEHLKSPVDAKDLSGALLRLSDLNAAQLERWVDLYADERFRRAVEPAVEVFNGATVFTEPQFMMLTISLEYFGYYLFNDGKRRTSAEFVQKALDSSGLEWPGIGSNVGIAEAIARVNNDLKHPNRESNPTTEELFGLIILAKAIARAQIYTFLDVDEKVKDDAYSYELSGHANEFFRSVGMRIEDDGTFTSYRY